MSVVVRDSGVVMRRGGGRIEADGWNGRVVGHEMDACHGRLTTAHPECAGHEHRYTSAPVATNPDEKINFLCAIPLHGEHVIQYPSQFTELFGHSDPEVTSSSPGSLA